MKQHTEMISSLSTSKPVIYVDSYRKHLSITYTGTLVIYLTINPY